MMPELGKRWHLLDTTGTNVKAYYIRSAANVLAGRVIRHLDSDDWQLDPVLFAKLDPRYGQWSIDRLASSLNMLLTHYNAGWLDPTSEAVDTLHLPDSLWCCENKRHNPRWPLLPNLVFKLRHIAEATTVIAPRWTGKVWHHVLTEMAVEELIISTRGSLFRPGRRAGRCVLGIPHLIDIVSM
jgi:hypothetical protein